jgi:L-ascorbate metabolism protein UlaG (beta-lactamase superfamily)
MLKLLPALCCLIVIGACGKIDYQPVADRAHHGAQGYVNPDASSLQRHANDFWGWSMRLWRSEPETAPQIPGSLVPDVGFLQRNRTENSITWVGHASVLLQVGGVNILTDPHFSKRASPMGWWGPKRLRSPGLLLHELPDLDVVFISNSHYDRLDEYSVKQIAAKTDPLFVVPAGIDLILKQWGITKISRLDWGETQEIKGVQLQLVPAQSWSWRWEQLPNQSLWAGLVVKAPDFSFYYAGCTAYGDFIKDIGDTHQGFDMAIFCVGQTAPGDYYQGTLLTPEQLVQAHTASRARKTLAVGWGTFHHNLNADNIHKQLTAATLAAGLAPGQVVLFDLGETGMWRPEIPEAIKNRGKTRDNPMRQWRKGEARPM